MFNGFDLAIDKSNSFKICNEHHISLYISLLKINAMRNHHSFSFNSAHKSKTNKRKKTRTEKTNRRQDISKAKEVIAQTL